MDAERLRSLDVAAAGYFAGGVASVVTGTPTTVEQALGHFFSVAWLIMLIVGPILSVGAVLLPNQWSGTWLRVAGGFMVSGALASFLVAAVQRFGWGQFTPWLVGGLTVASLAYLLLDVRALTRISRLARRMDSDR